MENNLKKMFTIGKINSMNDDTSSEYKTFIDCLKVKESETVLLKDIPIIDSINSANEFVDILQHEEFDGKITLAKFNKFLDNINFNEDDFFKYSYSIRDCFQYRAMEYNSSYWTLMNTIGYINEPIKGTFLDMINKSLAKRSIIPFGLNTYDESFKIVDLYNKFVLLRIFSDWKDKGYINSTFIDDLNCKDKLFRFMSTCKTALFNIKEKFAGNHKVSYIISPIKFDDDIDDYLSNNLSIKLINEGKGVDAVFGVNFDINTDIYSNNRNGYIKVFNSIHQRSNDILSFPSSIFSTDHERIYKYINGKISFPRHINFVNFFTITQRTANPQEVLNGEFNFSAYINRDVPKSNINSQTGFIRSDPDSENNIKSIPDTFIKKIAFCYNLFGRNVVNPEEIEAIDPLCSPDQYGRVAKFLFSLRKTRTYEYCDLTFDDLDVFRYNGANGDSNLLGVCSSVIHVLSTMNLMRSVVLGEPDKLEEAFSCTGRFNTAFLNFIIDMTAYFNSRYVTYLALNNVWSYSYSDFNNWKDYRVSYLKEFCTKNEWSTSPRSFSVIYQSDIAHLYNEFLIGSEFYTHEELYGINSNKYIFLEHFKEFLDISLSLMRNVLDITGDDSYIIPPQIESLLEVIETAIAISKEEDVK